MFDPPTFEKPPAQLSLKWVDSEGSLERILKVPLEQSVMALIRVYLDQLVDPSHLAFIV